MLKLKAVKYESLTSLLYVADQDENVYVLVDRGRQFDFISKPRYQLHTCSPISGEIRRLVDKPWELVKTLNNSSFPTGLRSDINNVATDDKNGKNIAG